MCKESFRIVKRKLQTPRVFIIKPLVASFFYFISDTSKVKLHPVMVRQSALCVCVCHKQL